jgi:hypothetical protein
MTRTVVLFISLFSLTVFGAAEKLALFDNGKSNVEIVVAPDAAPSVKFAGKELADFLSRCGSTAVKVVEKSSAPVRIYLGRLKVADRSFVIKAAANGDIDISGRDDNTPFSNTTVLFRNVKHRGTLEGVYWFLGKYCGIKFIEPGADGEYVPKLKILEIPVGETRITPAFSDRRCWHFERTWGLRDIKEYGGMPARDLWALRLGYSSLMEPVYGCHSVGSLKMGDNFSKTHPEWFALQRDKQRNFSYLCWSNPKVVDFWCDLAEAFFRGDATPEAAGINMKKWPLPYIDRDEFMVDPYDTGGAHFCKCPRCTELMKKYAPDGMSEIIWNTIVKVAERVGKKYPDKFISTLVYPPKEKMPRSVKIPPNLKVRVCTGGPNAIIGNPPIHKAEMARIKAWHEATGRKVPLWIYLINDFGDAMTEFPEVLPHLFQRYLREVRPDCSGMFIELRRRWHSSANMDLYAYAELLRDPETNVDKLLDEYCVMAYGNAAKPMREFFSRLEDNWLKILQQTWMNPKKSVPCWETSGKPRLTAYQNIYTKAEMAELRKIIEKAQKAVDPKSVYAKRIGLVDKYVLEFLEDARKERMDALEQKAILHLKQISGPPTEKDWESVPWLNMVSAVKGQKVLPSRFKALFDGKNFYLRGRFTEPDIAGSLSKMRSGKQWDKIWEDNEVELFFHSAKNTYPVQILINDNGFFAVHLKTAHSSSFKTDLPVTVKTRKLEDCWTLDAVIPNSVSTLDGGSDNSFNLIRSRNIKGAKTEYSTWSGDAVLGKWMLVDRFSPVRYVKVETPKKFTLQATAPEPGGEPAAVSNIDGLKRSGWSNWKPAKSRVKFNLDGKVGKLNKGSLEIDMREEKFGKSNPGGVWVYTHKLSGGEKKFRITVYGLLESPRPEAQLTAAAAWTGPDGRWVGYGKLGGSATIPNMPGKWRKISFEVPVPPNAGAANLLVTVGGKNVQPGRIWFDDLTLEAK